MPSDYSLSELAKLADVSPRTVRYYIAQGLLPSPVQQGPNTRYSDAHLDRLRLIKRLQNAHLPLADIRRQLGTLGADQVATLAESPPGYEPAADSALDYIESLLQPRKAMLTVSVPPAAASAVASRAATAPISLPSEPPAPPALEADRTQWERISLDPDIELHVRR